jgi:hypothetical protein
MDWSMSFNSCESYQGDSQSVASAGGFGSGGSGQCGELGASGGQKSKPPSPHPVAGEWWIPGDSDHHFVRDLQDGENVMLFNGCESCRAIAKVLEREKDRVREEWRSG